MAAPSPTPLARRTWKRRSDARAGELQIAALRLFARRGYGSATIEEIAREAGVTAGTVYRYFRDKEALRESLVDWIGREPLLPPGWDAEPNPDTNRIDTLLRTVWEASRRTPHAELLRLLVGEGGAVPDLVTRYREEALVPAENALAALLPLEPWQAVAEARAALGSLLGASLLAGAPSAGEPLVPQAAPVAITLAMLQRGLTPAPLPAASAKKSPPPEPTAPFLGPDSW